MAANVLKEFWPDLERKFRRKQHLGHNRQIIELDPVAARQVSQSPDKNRGLYAQLPA